MATENKNAADTAAAEAAKAPERTTYSATSKPDGAPVAGSAVKDGDLVRPTVPGLLKFVDNLTLVEYPAGTWTEAKASTWLDGQLRAGKIEVK